MVVMIMMVMVMMMAMVRMVVIVTTTVIVNALLHNLILPLHIPNIAITDTIPQALTGRCVWAGFCLWIGLVFLSFYNIDYIFIFLIFLSGLAFACGSGLSFCLFVFFIISFHMIGVVTIKLILISYHTIRCLASVGVCVIFLAVNLLALSGIARASSWHNKYPERFFKMSFPQYLHNIFHNLFHNLFYNIPTIFPQYFHNIFHNISHNNHTCLQSLPAALSLAGCLFLLQHFHSSHRSFHLRKYRYMILTLSSHSLKQVSC